MNRFTRWLTVGTAVAVFGLAAISCSDDSNPVTDETMQLEIQALMALADIGNTTGSCMGNDAFDGGLTGG
ncbi:MAG: hypothetical protein HKO65_00255, partial [Gemmatimonadetes bacterium]|nr:hypothetical protein [Gemmatimonadota bacterium]